MKTYIATFEVKVKYVVSSEDGARDHALDQKFFLDGCWAGRSGSGHAKTMGTSLMSLELKKREADHV